MSLERVRPPLLMEWMCTIPLPIIRFLKLLYPSCFLSSLSSTYVRHFVLTRDGSSLAQILYLLFVNHTTLVILVSTLLDLSLPMAKTLRICTLRNLVMGVLLCLPQQECVYKSKSMDREFFNILDFRQHPSIASYIW